VNAINTVFAGNMELSAQEIRVLGCLMEKQRTTPDVYPLSLNALRLACNQSTNRDPVVEYDEPLIRDALTRLERRGLVRMASGAGSRAAKYRHLLAERLPMDDAEQAIVCVLALRGPQTPGELKQRCERMHGFADLAEVHAALERLIERGLAERLPRRPGQKEERYRQLLEADAASEAALAPLAASPAPGEGSSAAVGVDHAAPPVLREQPAPTPAPGRGTGTGDELSELAARVQRLEREVAELRRALLAPAGEAGS
jgi:uncharacterized protein YceH (UPF0502 family)